MVDQCGTCDYMRQVTVGASGTTVQLMECRVGSPVRKMPADHNWPRVEATDWCAEFDPIGWNDPANQISANAILSTTVKTQIAQAPTSGYILILTAANVTNTSANKGVMVMFYDGNTATLIGAISAAAGQSEGRTFVINALSGEVWAQLDNSDGSNIYIFVQGRQVESL